MATDVQKCVNQTSNVIAPLAIAAGVGYLCARVFLIINPIHAAVFSASAVIVSSVVAPIFEKAFGGWTSSEASRICGKILGTGTAIALSAAVSTMLGFPVAFSEGIVLTGTIFATLVSTAFLVDLFGTKHLPA
ncbi:MAG: hypothetical protein H0X29_07585 [Parachlamydiaceae bacterium]|nr:hypothetical protein [Parachlamydiaceae bacterium]